MPKNFDALQMTISSSMMAARHWLNICQLCHDGYVRRTSDAHDRRAQCLSLTDTGRELVLKAFEAANAPSLVNP